MHEAYTQYLMKVAWVWHDCQGLDFTFPSLLTHKIKCFDSHIYSTNSQCARQAGHQAPRTQVIDTNLALEGE